MEAYSLKNALKVLVLVGLGFGTLAHSADDYKAKVAALPAVKGNCQIKFTKHAGSSLMLSYDSKSKEDCTKLSDPETQITYRPELTARKHGAGPNE